MREFELIIDKALLNGLSPEFTIPFNTQTLLDCLGFRCGKLGLEPYIELDNPLPVTVDMHYNWPFPQFIVGERYNILVVRDTFNIEDIVYSVSNDHTVVTQIAVIDVLTYGSFGTLMELADFGEYAFMTNGVVMIYWDTTLSAWQTITVHANIPLMRTICNFKGQAVGGNVVSAWHDCDEKFYIWSKIGEIDFTPDRRNEAGYRRCPYGGEVYHVRRLGDTVIGYSSKGITLLAPVKDPAATFGFVELSDVGLLNRGAMGGNLRRQIYVGDDFILREVTGQGIKELGYQSYMELLGSSEDIIINYEDSERNFYIGNSEKTFLLSPYGMTEVPQHPSAVWRRDKESYMLPDPVDDYSPLITTEAFDMGYKGQKTIATIETDSFLSTSPEVSVDYSFDTRNWSSADYKPINDQGVGTITASGNSFRFKLRFGSVDDGFRIGYMKVRYKMTDLRGIRGVYAPPPRGQG